MSKMAGPNVYRHYKGGLYRVLCECILSTNGPDDGKVGVIYVSMTNGNVFVRERNQFHEVLVADPMSSNFGRIIARFVRVAENEVLE